MSVIPEVSISSVQTTHVAFTSKYGDDDGDRCFPIGPAAAASAHPVNVYADDDVTAVPGHVDAAADLAPASGAATPAACGIGATGFGWGADTVACLVARTAAAAAASAGFASAAEAAET